MINVIPVSAVIAIACLTLSLACADAATFYVAPNGNDKWSGKLKQPNAAQTDGPLASLAGARDAIRKLKAQAGLTAPVDVIIADGTYELAETFALTPADSGTDACPITYAAAPGAKPVITGGRRITGWRKGEGNLWEADVPGVREGEWYFHQLFVNGKRAVRARTPNEGYLHIAGPIKPLGDRKKARGDSSTKMGFRFKPGDVKQWDNMDDVNVFLYHSWTSSLHWIKDVDLDENILRFVARSGWPVAYWDAKQRYHLENYFEALDSPGEWYLNRKTGVLHYWPREGEGMAQADVWAPRLGILLRAEGESELGLTVEHINFKGLSFQHADWLVKKTDVNDGQGAAFQKDAAVMLRGARKIRFEQCEIAHVGMYAIWFRQGSKDNTLMQCHIHDLGSGGIRIGETSSPRNEAQAAERTWIENSWIHDGGHVFPAGHGVWIGRSSYNTVRRCEISDFYYSGFGIGWSWGYAASSAHHNVVEYCHIHDLGKGVLSDMGAIYTLGVSPGTRLTNNVMHDVYSYSYGGWGLYNDEGSTGIVMENNIVYNTKSGGYHQHYGKENVLRNNVFAFSKEAEIIRSREEEHLSFTFERNIVLVDNGEPLGGRWTNDNYKMDHNVYWDINGNEMEFADYAFDEWQAKGHDKGSIIADPLFVDAKGYDFQLKPGSPAYKLGFKDIDTSQVGLYGSPEWTDPPKRIKRPPVKYPMPKPPVRSVNDDFESTPAGEPPRIGHLSLSGSAQLVVTDETAAVGKHSLKFVKTPDVEHGWQPHIYYNVKVTKGRVAASMYLRVEPGAKMYCEWRDYRGKYKVGPNFAVDPNGTLRSNRKPLLTLPHSKWVKIEMAAVVGAKKTGKWDMTITLPGQAPQTFNDLPFGNPAFRRLTWFGYSSTAPGDMVFYVDDVQVGAVK